MLPLLLTAGLAVLQLGLLGRDALLVSQAAREGAREAAVTTDEDRVREVALRAGGLRDDRAEIVVDRSGTTGDPVTVEVRYRAPLVVPYLGWLLPDSVSLRSSATMRQETP